MRMLGSEKCVHHNSVVTAGRIFHSYRDLDAAGCETVLLIFYVAHYFFLENTVQRWYRLAEKLTAEISAKTFEA